jgi:SAM-dependent methyltransferase
VVDHKQTPPYARYLAPVIRPFPNFDLFFVQSLRQKAVQLLQLKPGDRVLDAGCGPGGSFPYLANAVGASGEVIGIEISPGLAINARRRIESNRWRNVQVMEAPAESAKLEGGFDGLLMMGAPDVYASAHALANLLPYLKINARCVAFGAKFSHYALGKLLNPVFALMLSKFSFSSTPELSYKPWALLEARLADMKVEEQFFGCMFIASGSIVSPQKA